MNKQRTLYLLIFLLAVGQTLLLAQGDDATVSSEPQKERIKILPKVAIPETTLPASPSGSAFPGGMEQLSPVRHLWADADCDGLLDLMVIDPLGSRLFHNRGRGGFDNVTSLAFSESLAPAIAGSWGDYNRDKKPDLFLFHLEGFSLFRNDGRLRFSNVTEDLGLDPALRVSAVQLKDIDDDGNEDLLVQTPEGEKIYHNQGNSSFEKITVVERQPRNNVPSQPGSGPAGNGAPSIEPPPLGKGSTRGRANPPFTQSLGTPQEYFAKAGVYDSVYVNDNSPGSVGVGVPEVEGGDDGSVQNDIVDGTITGADIDDNSVPASRIIGTAATLTGSQNFDSGTFYVDASDNAVGIGTTSPTDASLHVESSADYGCRVENDYSRGYAFYGTAPETAIYAEAEDTDGYTYAIHGVSASDQGRGVYGVATSTTGEVNGVRGYCSNPSGRGVYGRNSAATGEAQGVFGITTSESGHGVHGWATDSSGFTRGVYGESSSSSGCGVYGISPGNGVRGESTATTGCIGGVTGEGNSDEGMGVFGLSPFIGVYGWATTSSGENYGVRGDTDSTEGYGVRGGSYATSGVTCGVQGESASTSGRGVLGIVTAASGTNYGVRGESDSTSGRGIFGWASSLTGYTHGVKGEAHSENGTGVTGVATNSSGGTYGVYGGSYSSDGRGVYGGSPYIGVEGNATSTSGTCYGVYGRCDSSYGRSIFGWGQSSTGSSYGVYGRSDSSSGRATYGYAASSTGTNYGVRGYTASSSGYGVYSAGDFGCSGDKYFVQPHPEDASKEIRFVCLEGNESGTYFRGSSRLDSGKAVIEVPEEFRFVTEEEGLTVQVTPLGPGRIWVETRDLNQVVVRGDMDVDFDYFVNGVRRGYSEFESIRENHEWVPEYRDIPFGTQYPPAVRQILVENGTLNPDFTPNKKTAARMRWELRDFAEENPPLAQAKKEESRKGLDASEKIHDMDPGERANRKSKKFDFSKLREALEDSQSKEPTKSDSSEGEPVERSRKELKDNNRIEQVESPSEMPTW